MEDLDRTELADPDPTRTLALTKRTAGEYQCPRCFTAYSRDSIRPPEYKCSCGLELAYPEISPGGEVKGVLGWLSSPGTVVHQRYRVVQLLGRGGFGSTYLAEDMKLSNKRWALKEIPELMFDEHESRILAKLNHPSIPGITDREVVDGMVYMVLEFGGNRTFETVRRATPDKRIGLSQLAPWARQLCDVLAYMHAQTPPIVHRDLKPGNVLLDDQDRVMLIDFGIAKEAIESEQTRALGRAVTHGFSPPEQAMGSGTDARSDVYALGATIYYMLTAQRPPGARERIQGIEIGLPSTLVPGIPPAIDRALLQALSLNPNERQQTVQEFGRAFDYDAPTVKTYDDFAGPERTVLVGSATTTRSVPTTRPQKSLRLGPEGAAVVLDQVASAPRGNRLWLIAVGAGTLVVAAIVGTYLFTRSNSTPAVVSPSAAAIAAAAPPAATAPPPLTPSAPVVSMSPSGSSPPTVTAAVAPAPVISPPPVSGSSAMEELLKRRQSSVEEPVAYTHPSATIDKPPTKSVKPNTPYKPKPAPVAAVAPPAPLAPSVPAAAGSWQKANANTQFNE
ncbi:MAG: serine/threonine protein kinase [Gammaproteobacteria bacterium]|nr:serine/threonine protein kinase [Gammaproteobacteria bacterium]